MRKTPTGQRADSGEEPTTATKELMPGVPSPASAAAKVDASPAPTQARPRTPRQAGRPPSGRRGRNKNPLEEPPDDLPPPPPPRADAAQEEAALVGDTPRRANAAGAGDPSSPNSGGADVGDVEMSPVRSAGAAGDQSPDAPLPGAPDAAEADAKPTGSRRVLRTNVALLILAFVPLAAAIVLAVLQGGFVDERIRRTRIEDSVDDVCLQRGSILARTIAEEALAADHLQTFHDAPATAATPAGVVASSTNTTAYRDARAAFDEAVARTDTAISTYLAVASDAAHTAFSNHHFPPAWDAFNNGLDTTRATAVDSWVTKRGFATRFAKRLDAAVPSLVPDKVLDLDSVESVRRHVYAGGAPYTASSGYASLLRELAGLCGTLTPLAVSPRVGDASILASIGAIASAAASASLVSAAGGSIATSASTVQVSGSRAAGLYDAHGTRVAARSWPVAVPELGVPSTGVHAATPDVVALTTSSAYTSAAAALSPQEAPALKRRQMAMVGRMSAFLHASSTSEKSSHVPTYAAASQAMLWFAVAIAVVGAATAIIFAFVEVMHRDRYDLLDKELESVHHAIKRMRFVVEKVRALKLSAIAALRRKVRMPRPEETALYGALANLREAELFLPSTIAAAPYDAPHAGFTSDGLYVRPRLTPRKLLFAIRVDLAHLHRKFSDVDAKKQAVHHHLVRFLATVDDAVSSIVPGCFVQPFGASVSVIVNLTEDVEFPGCAALLAANEIASRAMEVFNIVPSIAVASGTAVIGNVGSLTCKPNSESVAHLAQMGDEEHTHRAAARTRRRKDADHHVPLDTLAAEPTARAFKAFSTFGQLNDEVNMLTAIAKLHELPIVCSAGVMSAATREVTASKVHGAARGIPLRCTEAVMFRALELVTRVETHNQHNQAEPVVSHQPSAAGSEARAMSLLPTAMFAGASGDRNLPNARLTFEIVRVNEANMAAERRRILEWNKTIRFYTSGQLSQALQQLRKFKDVFGDSNSIQRFSKLIAAAQHVNGQGDSSRPSAPFVATYWEVMRDALVECA